MPGAEEANPGKSEPEWDCMWFRQEMGNFLHMRSYKATDTFKLYLLYYSNPEYYIFTCFYLIEHVFEGIFTMSLV